ncbi:serine protease [Tychonema sp. BBK16]|uniref:serine protease n=1 Tax=Tychonema sp. BBK16 TaxID=2699888 RepID=UPI001F23216A|nr:serine protease [Tychonema sp. BBK16]MCF6372495.1 serine protease [Tychonema sp. BBK16]
MNKELIRLTLVLGLAATLGACAGETAPTATPSPAGDTSSPAVSTPAPTETPKSSPGAEKSPTGGSASPAASPSPKKP